MNNIIYHKPILQPKFKRSNNVPCKPMFNFGLDYDEKIVVKICNTKTITIN